MENQLEITQEVFDLIKEAGYDWSNCSGHNYPLYQQVIHWLLEEHNIFIQGHRTLNADNSGYYFVIDIKYRYYIQTKTSPDYKHRNIKTEPIKNAFYLANLEAIRVAARYLIEQKEASEKFILDPRNRTYQ